MRFLPILLIALIVTGCTTAAAPPPPPAVYQFPASRQMTKEAIVATYLGRGFQIVRDSDFQLVMDRPANDNFGAQILFGSQWNGVPNARLSLTFLGDGPTSVHANMAVVTNPGSGFEQVTDITNNPQARADVSTGMSQAIALAESRG